MNKFRLYTISQNLFTIPANLWSARNFGYSGITFTHKRSTIIPEMVNKLLIIRSNFEIIYN